jgi:hypothetical protein
MQQLTNWMGNGPLGALELVALMLLLTIVLETITCAFRFGLDLQATRDTRVVAKYTKRVRIHHVYLGVAVLGLGLALPPIGVQAALIIGGALALSDLIHHFFVLWPLTGSHEFDLRYPKAAPVPVER